MELTLDNLKEAGAFTGAPVEREIKWEMGGKEYTATVYVRPLSFKSAVSDIKLSGQDKVVAGRIASCICDKDGKAIFTAEDITGEADPVRGPLDDNLTVALLRAISEVNSLGKSRS